MVKNVDIANLYSDIPPARKDKLTKYLLLEAIEGGDLDALKDLAKYGITLKNIDLEGYKLITILVACANEIEKEDFSKILSFLTQQGCDINAKNASNGYTAHDIAIIAGYTAKAQILKNSGAKVNPKLASSKFITNEELEDIILNSEDKVLNITDILKKGGYAPQLEFRDLEIPKGKFETVILSNLSLKNLNVTSYKGTKIILDGSNLEDACFLGSHLTAENISVVNANLKGAEGHIDESLKKSLSSKQLNESDFIQINQDNYFYQFKFVGKYWESFNQGKGGLCHGLAREYVRYKLKHPEPQNNFFDKLSRKLEKESPEFNARLEKYLSSFKIDESNQKKYTFVDLDQEIKGEFLKSLPAKLQKSNFLGVVIKYPEDGYNHSCVISVIKDAKGNVKGYKLYDTSYGETDLLTSKELVKILKALNDSISSVFIYDLEKEVKKGNLVKHQNNTDHFDNDSKNIHKLYKAIDEDNLKEIARLSKVVKIDAQGFKNPDNIAHSKIIEGDLEYNNILEYAIISGSKEAVLELINNNNQLRLNSEEKASKISTFLITNGKMDVEILKALSAKSIESNASEVFDEFVKLKEESDLEFRYDTIKHDYSISVTADQIPYLNQVKEGVDMPSYIEILENGYAILHMYYNTTHDGEFA